MLLALGVLLLVPHISSAASDVRTAALERLCQRQADLGSRLPRPLVAPAICAPTPPPPAEPTLVFSASPTTIESDESSTLIWDSSNATTCTASGGWNGSKAVDGSEVISPDVTTLYTLTCAGPGGSVTKSATVTVSDPEPVPPTLTLVKVVTNNNGGTATQSSFQAKINGSDVPWGTPQTVTVGSHTVSETSMAGYVASSWGGDCAANGTITLAAGENKTCTITNDDAPGVLRVIKVVVNNNGGTAEADDFSFTVNGGAATAFESDGQNDVGVNAGTYTVTEVAAAGYSTTYSNCGSVSVALGETETCTITNDDIAPQLGTITEIVVADDRFDTLETAVVTAGLADDLGGTGPFTVFAPTDDAFAELPEGVLAALIAAPAELAEVLLYHVATGELDASEVAALDTLATLLGPTVDITVTDTGVMVNDANIIITNIPASNGIIHVIDAVLVPPVVPTGAVVISEVHYDVSAPGINSGNDNNEWVEIYNGTNATVDLSGWTLTDNNASDALPEGTLLGAGEYLLVTATSSTKALFGIGDDVQIVVLGNQIGNGLAASATGDVVFLRNAESTTVDAVSWGTNVDGLNPGVVDVLQGHSIARSVLTNDTNTAVDWVDRETPTPGQ